MYRFLLPSFARSDRRDCGYQFGASSYIVESQVDAGRKVVQFFFVLNFEHDLSLHTSDMPRLPCPCTIAIGLTPYTRNGRHKSLLREYALTGSTRSEEHILVCDQHILSYRTVVVCSRSKTGRWSSRSNKGMWPEVRTRKICSSGKINEIRDHSQQSGLIGDE